MKRLALLIAVLLLAGAAAGVLLPALQAQDPTLDPVTVGIRDLKQGPEKFVGLTVRFEGMFHNLENLWAPFFTPFVREDYLVFSVWPSDAEIWTKDGRLDDLPTCFLRKSDKLVKMLLNLKPYIPIQVSGTVLSDFHKLPWIEVSSIEVQGGPRYTAEEVRALIKSVPEQKEPAAAPAPEKAGAGAPPAPEAGAIKSLQARVTDLERSLASRQAEGADLRKQIEALKGENVQLNVRFTDADRARRDAEKTQQEAERSALALKVKNEAMAKRVADLEGMLRRIFGSIEAATEKLKEVEKQQGGEKPAAPAQAPAPAAPAQARAQQ
jgi:hypothetical protein